MEKYSGKVWVHAKLFTCYKLNNYLSNIKQQKNTNQAIYSWKNLIIKVMPSTLAFRYAN